MILSKHIFVQLTSTNIKYYENLGYIIPRIINHNRLVVLRGTKIVVNIKDVPHGCYELIWCECEICHKIRLLHYKDYRPLCYKCIKNTINFKELKRQQALSRNSWQGENNPFYNSHRTGKLNPNFNQKLSQNERLNSQDRSIIPNYKANIKKAKQRDCKCLICNSTKHLQVHHIKSFKQFPELRCDINNMITLCFDHHLSKTKNSIHKLYGQNPTEENLNEFIQTFKIN